MNSISTPETSNLLRDANQNFIPQMWDPDANSGQGGYVPYGGSAQPPKLLGTYTSSQITSTLPTTISYAQVLNRNAQQRTFIFINTTGVSISSLNLYPFDSTLTSLTPANTNYFASIPPPANNSQTIATSEDSSSPRFSILASHIDSVQFIVTFSAIPAQGTSGGLSFYVVEYFD